MATANSEGGLPGHDACIAALRSAWHTCIAVPPDVRCSGNGLILYACGRGPGRLLRPLRVTAVERAGSGPEAGIKSHPLLAQHGHGRHSHHARCRSPEAPRRRSRRHHAANAAVFETKGILMKSLRHLGLAAAIVPLLGQAFLTKRAIARPLHAFSSSTGPLPRMDTKVYLYRQNDYICLSTY